MNREYFEQSMSDWYTQWPSTSAPDEASNNMAGYPSNAAWLAHERLCCFLSKLMGTGVFDEDHS